MPQLHNSSTIYNEYIDEDDDIGNNSNVTQGDNYFINYYGKIDDVIAKIVAKESGDYMLELSGFLQNDDNTKDKVDIKVIVDESNIYKEGLYTGLEDIDIKIENKILSIKLKSECHYGLYIIVRPLTVSRDKININFDKTDVDKYFLHII